MSNWKHKAPGEDVGDTAFWELSGKLESDARVRTWLAELDQVIQYRERSARRHLRHYLAIAASIALAVGVGCTLFMNRATSYSTAVGEQRDVALADGSRMTLNTASEARVRITKHERRVELLRGEAVFDVVHDAGRPFDVAAGRSVVRALGTRFNIEVSRHTARVAILDGVVQLRDNDSKRDSPATEIPVLTRGQVASLDGSKVVSRASQNELRRIAAWQDRKIEFDDQELASAISEYNRYSARPFVIGTAGIGNVKFSGVFRIGDVEAFRYALEHSLGLRVVATAEGYVVSGGTVLRPRSAAG